MARERRLKHVVRQDKELMEEADKPKGFGKGGKACGNLARVPDL